ncbi:unnamed protein product [Effrenium voratum]|nr:unnamed protein product [Effrenium voratum]
MLICRGEAVGRGGKSYSVLGGKGEERGLLPRVVEGLFDHFAKLPEGATYKTLVAFMEIYNEQIRDLLAPANDSETKKLEVKQHPVLGTIVPGLTEAAVASSPEVLALVDYGSAMRHVSATAMNATSSRSHCIFTFKTNLTEPEQPSKVSQTHLVDLAGSERAGRTKATGDRLKEGAAINQSLSTLARVISELAKSAKSKKKPNPPFRESKLTYILKESLCGNSKTVMMAAISPNFLDYDETLSTLKFAQSVKQVQTKAVQNAVNMSSVEAQLRAELNALKAQLQSFQDQSGGSPAGMSEEESVYLKRRVEEQEQLCALHGTDWPGLLALEQSRMQRRTAMPSAQDLAKLQAMEERSGDEENDDEDDDTFTCSLLELGRSQEGNPPEGRSSLRAPIRSQLQIGGPLARELSANGDQRGKAEQLKRQLTELSAVAVECEEVLNEDQDVDSEMSLKVLVVIDPLDDKTLEAGLVVQAAASSSLPSSWAWPRHQSEGAGNNDWCSGKELQQRLSWLKENRSVLAKGPAEAWLAASQVGQILDDQDVASLRDPRRLVQHSEVEEGFESKALVFISQQDAQSQPALREVLRLSKGETDALMAEADGELKQVLELHGLARPPGQLAHLKPLCHCVLNSAMSMCDMLTEPRCEALQWLVELRARESLARRFEGKPCTAVLDGLEFRRGQLEDWKRLLAPFSQVLTAAGLCEPLTKHVQLVRSYEFLRCLGGELLDGDMQSSLEKLRQHGERFAAWQAAGLAEDALAAYRKTVMASDVPKDVLEAEAQAEARGADLARLGFRPSAVLKIVALGGAVPGMVRGASERGSGTLHSPELMGRLLTLAEQEASAQLDADTSLRELHQHFVQMAEACKSTAPVEAPDSILKFLLQVAKDYLSRGGGAAHLNFELLARGSPNMQLLRTLETHPAAQRVLGDMALSELLQVASLIREAQHMVHKDAALHGNLQRWLSRLDANELHPAEVGELSAALHDFLKQNLAARLAAQEMGYFWAQTFDCGGK